MTSNIKQIKDDFGKLATCLKDDRLEIFALNEFKVEIGRRLWTDNRDIDNVPFGTYRSASYKKKREAAGRQTNKKDLQFTDEFRNDFDLGKKAGNNALGFAQDRSDKIAKAQESASQIGSPIFAANDEEVDIVFGKINDEVNKILEECLNL